MLVFPLCARGFTGSLRVLRRAVPLFQQAASANLPIFASWLMEEILAQQIPPRQGRINPRVVKKRTARAEVSPIRGQASALGRSKKPRSKFKSKKRSHRNRTTQLQPLTLALPRPAA